MTSDTLTSPSGRTLARRARATTTPTESSEAKVLRIAQERATRLAENEALLADSNVAAYLKAIAEAEGGGYDFKYGAVLGREPADIPQRQACIRSPSIRGASMVARWA